MACTGSRWRRTWWGWVRSSCAGTKTQGLLSPDRTPGGTRRYSDEDLTRLRRIDALLDAGLNTAGVAMVIELQDEIDDLNEELTRARQP